MAGYATALLVLPDSCPPSTDATAAIDYPAGEKGNSRAAALAKRRDSRWTTSTKEPTSTEKRWALIASPGRNVLGLLLHGPQL
jgi:hypothetical protein